MKYHPMDDILRPAASAARKAAHGLDRRRPSTTSESATFVEDTEGSDDEDREDHPKTRAAVSEAFASPPRRPVPLRSGSPSCRRITRAEVNGEKPVLYDMKHHPMDIVTRPAAAKRVYKRYSSFPNVTSPGMAPKSQPSKTAKERHKHSKAYEHAPTIDIADDSDAAPVSDLPTTISPTPKTAPSAGSSKSEQDTTATSVISLWKSVPHSDRLLYNLQKGAPINSTAPPLSWHDATEELQAILGIDFTAFGVGHDGQVTAVRTHYADFHRRLQEDYGADQEPAEMGDWTLDYAEGFNVYDFEVGDKYFKSRSDRVVQEPFYRAYEWIPCQPKAGSQHGTVEAASHPSDHSDSSISTPNGTNTVAETQADIHCENVKSRHTDGENKENEEQNADEEPSDLPNQGLLSDEGESTAGPGTADSEDGHRLVSSYNDAEGYLRQSRGQYDNDLLVEENNEDELITIMRDSVNAIVQDVMGLGELAPMFSSSAGLNGADDVVPVSEATLEEVMGANGMVPMFSPSAGQNEDEDSEPVVVRKRPLNRRSRNRTSDTNFSVHEDEPGNTPRIKRQIAMNPRSPGTDIPKENLLERSASEEIGSRTGSER